MQRLFFFNRRFDFYMVAKIFANSDFIATIPCPSCGKAYQKDVSKFMGHRTQVRLKYTCKCKHSFSVQLERRRSIRKDVHLKGRLIDENKKIPLTITDISKYGLKINFSNHIVYELGSIIHVEFVLDDPNDSHVSTQVKIKRFISPLCAGCEFLSNDHYDNLGKYFLFHF